MTDQLKDLLHQRADSVDFALPDTDSITTVGDRRLRRRRTTRLGAGLAALALVGSGTALLATHLGGGGGRAADPASGSDPFAGHVTWVTGSVLHTSDDQVDLGHPVAAYVQTDLGVVFADTDGAVWSWTGSAATAVGHVGPKVHLVANGTRAGWVDDDGGRTQFAVVDQSTGTVERDVVRADPGVTLEVEAIDGATTYVRDNDGVVALDLHDGSGPVVAPGGQGVLAAEAGVIAFASDDHHTTRVGTTLAGAQPIADSYGAVGQLSPGARWFNGDADAPDVTDLTTRTPVTLHLPSASFADGYRWLDADTLAVETSDGDHGDLTIYSCHLPDGACTQAAAPGTMADYESGRVLLPLGMSIGD